MALPATERKIEPYDAFLWPIPQPIWQQGYVEKSPAPDAPAPGDEILPSMDWLDSARRDYRLPDYYPRMRYRHKRKKWTINGPRMMRFMFQYHLDEMLQTNDIKPLLSWLAYPELLTALAASYGAKGWRLYNRIRYNALDLNADQYIETAQLQEEDKQRNPQIEYIDPWRIYLPQRVVTDDPAVYRPVPPATLPPVFPQLFELPIE